MLFLILFHQTQMIMQQNLNHIHNPLMIQLQHSYDHDRHHRSNVVLSHNNDIDNNVARCNWFPVSDWMDEMQSIGNRAERAESRTGHVDMDSFINFQCEKMRKMVQEQRRIELAWLVKKFETRTLSLMSQKDEQIRQQMLHIMQLQRLSSTLQLDNESLHNMARQNQATIESLDRAILQLHEFKNHPAEDAESCCDEADVTSRRESSEKLRVICGGCDSREANVVFLPCRHLCACDVCEVEMTLCPFCKRHKSSSIMTLVF